MMHNLSHPEGSSVNDYMPLQFSSVHYATMQDAIYFIKESQSIVFMAKVDIEPAFPDHSSGTEGCTTVRL